MKMKLLIIPILLIFQSATAQQSGIKLFFKRTAVEPGDTLVFGAQVNLNGGPMAMGSLFLKVVNEQGKVWNLRWPVFSGVMSAAVAIPHDFPTGQLDFIFSATTNFFHLTGTVIKPRRLRKIKLMLLTKNADSENEEIELDAKKSFKYRFRVFEEEAKLFFTTTNNESEDLDIEISTPLDSVFAPLAHGYERIIVGKPPVKKDKLDSIDYTKIDSLINSRAKTLATVTVTAAKKTQAQEFAQLYVNGIFSSQNERTFDFLEEHKNARNVDVLDFIKIRAPGMQIFRKPDVDGITSSGSAVWRDAPVLFFIDQFEVDFKTIIALNIADVAIIKLFPPPFAGAKMGNGAAIAVYTKRGKFYGGSPRHNFKVMGYNAPLSELPVTPHQ